MPVSPKILLYRRLSSLVGLLKDFLLRRRRGSVEVMSTANPPFWLGGVAGSMAACVTHPLDLTKLRMQTASSGAAGASTLKVLRDTIALTGVRSLYTGLSASVLRQMTYSLVRLGSYESIKSWISKGKQASTGQLLLAAGLAGGLGGVAGNPADILLVRMTTDPLKPPEARHRYVNVLNGLIRLIREEGMQGFTRGLLPNTTRAVLMNTSQLASYDFFKTYLLTHSLPMTNLQLEDNLALHTIASSLAGTVATRTPAICSPADVIKSRMMSSTGSASVVGILTKSLREEGPMFIFKGWTPAFIRLAPNTVLLFVFLEQLKKAWRASSS
ncbi:dicarboxylic acid transporter [Ramaria rubella]|nr:dicarboxylic acid transporter [Ramaria rubella]